MQSEMLLKGDESAAVQKIRFDPHAFMFLRESALLHPFFLLPSSRFSTYDWPSSRGARPNQANDLVLRHLLLPEFRGRNTHFVPFCLPPGRDSFGIPVTKFR